MPRQYKYPKMAPFWSRIRNPRYFLMGKLSQWKIFFHRKVPHFCDISLAHHVYIWNGIPIHILSPSPEYRDATFWEAKNTYGGPKCAEHLSAFKRHSFKSAVLRCSCKLFGSQKEHPETLRSCGMNFGLSFHNLAVCDTNLWNVAHFYKICLYFFTYL